MELGTDKTVGRIIYRLKSAKAGEGVVKVEGTWGSFARLLTVYISEKLSRPILYICPHIDDADKAADDLHTFGGERVDVFGAWEGEEDLADATDEIRTERLRVVSKVHCLTDSSTPLCSARNDIESDGYMQNYNKTSQLIVTAPIQALCQPIPKPEVIEAGCLQLETDKEKSPEEVVEWLVENGFERVERIDLPGQFARRPGGPPAEAPYAQRAFVDKLLGRCEQVGAPLHTWAEQALRPSTRWKLPNERAEPRPVSPSRPTTSRFPGRSPCPPLSSPGPISCG